MNKGATICLVVTILIMLFILFMVFCPPKAANAEGFHGNMKVGFTPQTEAVVLDLNISFEVWRVTLYAGVDAIAGKEAYNVIVAKTLLKRTFKGGCIFDITENFYAQVNHSYTEHVYGELFRIFDPLNIGHRTDLSVGYKW